MAAVTSCNCANDLSCVTAHFAGHSRDEILLLGFQVVISFSGDDSVSVSPYHNSTSFL